MTDGLEFVTYEKNLCYPEYLIYYSRVYEAPFSFDSENELADYFVKWPIIKPHGAARNRINSSVTIPVSPTEKRTLQRHTRFVVLTTSAGAEGARLHYYTDSSRSVYKGEFL